MKKELDDENASITIFGPETEFDGELEFSNKLIITGKFNGSIKAEGDLEIEKNAICTGEKFVARSVVIYGKVTGNIEAKERVEICSGSSVFGDITTARLRIANNVNFEGQVSMIEKEPDVDLFSVASSEFKHAMILKSDTIQ